MLGELEFIIKESKEGEGNEQKRKGAL